MHLISEIHMHLPGPGPDPLTFQSFLVISVHFTLQDQDARLRLIF